MCYSVPTDIAIRTVTLANGNERASPNFGLFEIAFEEMQAFVGKRAFRKQFLSSFGDKITEQDFSC